jgi:CheY-like chemotaxis protein/HPt (histidine-containing phosphotransfer) domain-containing protein/anti-sigma regulatory factor (Ser/Thr protein kinase)
MRENRGRKSGETCGQIFASGEHLLGVINDILDFSKIEAGKLSVEARAFALAGVTDQVMSFLSGSATDKGLPLHLALADDLPAWVLGDALRLRQVLVNLLGNAIKFTPQGEIRLTVTRCGDMTSFCVSDTGIGMRPEQLGRLFTAFEQADNSTTRLFGGTGLGLAISRQLARLMGGDIEASSSVGQGCVFTLRLPLPATAAPERLAEPLPRSGADAGPRLTGWRVLAAEDVAVNRLVLADLLEQEGAHVLFAENGREAIDQVRRAISGESPPFDLVLMDIQMPVMDGLQATCCLREIAPDLPVIGLTAHALAEERDRCLEAGMVDHVTKPIDPEELVAALLRHARARPAPPESAPPLPLAAALSPPPLADRPPIDWAALSERFQGRQAFIDKLIGLAIQSNRETPHKLRIAARQGNHAAISFIAHSLKGFCGNIHAKSAHELACQTEEAARAGSDNVPYLAECLAEQLVVLLAAMEARNGK